ncbi:MAG: hypothetical protein BGP06_06890 [Rhizobiales bacterium 65-9]|nr:MAG: hypothetical protein BGP06_06890 [Rhizobiales bacterium 65-9]
MQQATVRRDLAPKRNTGPIFLRTILVNHLLEPPARVTGITRFLFALLAALLATTEDSYVLLTCWAESDLPPALLHPRLKIVTRRFRKSAALNSLAQNATVARAMKQTGATIELNSNPLGAWKGSWPRAIVVHDLYLETMPEAYAWRHRAVWRVLFPKVAHSAAAIIVPSGSTRQDLLDGHPETADKIRVVPEAPAFSPDKEIGRAPIEGRYGLMVGNMSPNKNPAPVVEALALLAARGVEAPVLHIGGDDRGLLRAALADAGGSFVTSISGVDDAALKGAYANAAFFINSSLHEGFCLPIVEAQSLGAPVIASNRSALPEIAGEGALLIDPTSPIQIADAIQRVWTDDAFAQDLARRGSANARRFSWERTAKMLAAIFDEMDEARPDRRVFASLKKTPAPRKAAE